jgi:hypothetical protein
MLANSNRWWTVPGLVVLGLVVNTRTSWGGSVGWLDDVVRQVVRGAERGSKVEARAAGRLFAHPGDESLEALARRSDELARATGRLEEPAEAVLRSRFNRLVSPDPEMARTFAGLSFSEKRLVVEMGETAEALARRYPGRADEMVRKLGVEGMSAVRAYGDDVAEVVIEEGPQSVNVLRKTGRSGWSFFTGTVLPHKKKLIAAGVFGLYLANPEKFVDTTGRATRYAVEQFARAGIALAGAVGSASKAGVESAVGGLLADWGLDSGPMRWLAMTGAAVCAGLALLVLLGLPIRWALRPLTWPVRWIWKRGPRTA